MVAEGKEWWNKTISETTQEKHKPDAVIITYLIYVREVTLSSDETAKIKKQRKLNCSEDDAMVSTDIAPRSI